MSRLLIGSSNVYRFYKPESFPNHKPCAMVKCTNLEVFKARMATLESTDKEVIISVVENLICDAVLGTLDSEDRFNEKLEERIKEYLKVVQDCATKFLGSKFVLVRPTLRPTHKWYMENHDNICKAIDEGVGKMSNSNIGRVYGLSRMSQQFENDGVHYNETSGRVFLDTILSDADTYFKAELIELDEEKMVSVEEYIPAPISSKTCHSGDSSKKVESDPLLGQLGIDGLRRKVNALEEDLGRLGNSVERNRSGDILMFARIREELDSISNSKKEDRIVVTGLTNSVPMPQSIDGKRKWLNEMVAKTLDGIVPGSSANIQFVDLGKKNSREIPLVEVKMRSREAAVAIRRQFAAKKKEGSGFGRLFLTNSVTLATRVRIDILRAMARQCIGDDETAFVNAYTSRPVLTLKKKDESLRPLVLTFADAVARFGKVLSKESLAEAYKRAGNTFGGQLEQTFVVLKNSQSPLGFHETNRGLRSGVGGIRTPAKKRQNGQEGNRDAKMTKI